MDERKQAKANLNRQLEREGGLQRAGMRKCIRIWYRDKELEEKRPHDKDRWERKWESETKVCLVSKDTVYFHSFVSGEDDYSLSDRRIIKAVLEHEDGRVFTWEAENIVFIT